MNFELNRLYSRVKMKRKTVRFHAIPSKTATLVPEFAVEDLPLDRTATLVPEFAVENLPLERTATLV